MNRFDRKVALVTGGTSGIGLAIANRLQQEGARVFTAQRSPDTRFEGIEANLADPEAPAAIVDHIITKTRQLDVLINNAGMMCEGSIVNSPLEDWHKTLAVNLTAPFLLIRAALPHLASTRGAIVNTGSIEGLGSNPGHAAYCASKAGLHGLTRAVAVDHGQDGVRCNAIAPGWIDTELNVDFIDSMADPHQFRQQIGKVHPVGRTGDPEEVAALAAFLASSDASFITGQIMTVDGGRMAQLSLP